MGYSCDFVPDSGLPGTIRFLAQRGRELATLHANAHDSIASQSDVAAWTYALSVANMPRFGGEESDILLGMAQDGVGLLNPKMRKGRFAQVQDSVAAMAQLRKRARNRLRAMEQDAVLPVEIGTQVTRMVPALFHSLPWEFICPASEDAPQLGMATYLKVKADVAGTAHLGNGLQANQALASVSGAVSSTPINHFMVETEIDPLSLAQAQAGGFDLAAQNEAAAMFIMNKAVGNKVFNSAAAFNYGGLLDGFSKSAVTGDATALDSATVPETVAGVLLGFAGYENAAGDALPPRKVLISQKVWTKLAGNYDNGVSGRKYLMEQYPDVQWKPAVALNAAVSTAHAMIIANDDSQLGVRTAIASSPLVYAYQNGLAQRTMYVRPFAGVVFGYIDAWNVTTFAA